MVKFGEKLGEIKFSLEGLNNRVTAAEYKISDMENELCNKFIQQKRLQESFKINDVGKVLK